MIEGRVYNSISEASSINNIERSLMRYRLKSNNYPEYFYIQYMKHLKTYKIFESAITATRLEIPYETYAKDPKTGFLDPQNKIFGKSKIIDYADRKIVVFNVNGIHVPFYLSSGHGGKKDVTSGKWYPFFGIYGPDRWLNKSSSSDINNYYGVNLLKQISQSLDSKIGDIRNDSSIPKVSPTGTHIDFINKDLTPVENERPDTKIKFAQNLENLKRKLWSI